MTENTYSIIMEFRAPWILVCMNEGARNDARMTIANQVFDALEADDAFLSWNHLDGFEVMAEVRAENEASAVHEITAKLLGQLPELDLLQISSREEPPAGFEIEIEFHDPLPRQGADPVARQYDVVDGIMTSLDLRCRIHHDRTGQRYRVTRDAPSETERDAIAGTLNPLLDQLNDVELLEVTSRPLS